MPLVHIDLLEGRTEEQCARIATVWLARWSAISKRLAAEWPRVASGFFASSSMLKLSWGVFQPAYPDRLASLVIWRTLGNGWHAGAAYEWAAPR